MGNLETTNKILAKRNRSFLDIGFYDNGQKKVILNKLFADKNWKKMALTVFENYKVPEIFIDIYAPNGSSYKLDQSVMMSQNMLGYSSSSQQLGGLASEAGNSPGGSQFFQYVINEKDEKIRERNEMIAELKDQHKLDTDTIKELREKNIELERENRFKEKEFELQRYEDELAEKENAKSGFSGVVDTAVSKISEIAANPQLMEMAKLYLTAKMGQTVGQSQVDPMPNNVNIKQIVQWLQSQDETVIANFYALADFFAKNPGQLSVVTSQLTKK